MHMGTFPFLMHEWWTYVFFALATPVQFVLGKQYIVGILVDVTKERETQEKTSQYLQMMEQRVLEAQWAQQDLKLRCQALQLVNDHPVLVLDPKTFEVLEVNQAFKKRFKYRKKHLEQAGFRALFSQETWMMVFERLNRALDKERFSVKNISCVTFEETTFEADLYGTIQRGERGATLVVQVEDRSKILGLENNLDRFYANLHKLIEEAPIGVIGFKSDGTVNLVNQNFLLG